MWKYGILQKSKEKHPTQESRLSRWSEPTRGYSGKTGEMEKQRDFAKIMEIEKVMEYTEACKLHIGNNVVLIETGEIFSVKSVDVDQSKQSAMISVSDNGGQTVFSHTELSTVKPRNNTCPKCGGTVTGEQVEFISDQMLTQDVTCDNCGYIFRHYYELVEVEEI